MPSIRSASRYQQGLPVPYATGLLACLFMPHFACASPVGSNHNQLIIDSFVNTPAKSAGGNAAQSPAQTMTDIALGSAPKHEAAPGGTVAAMMQAQFDAAGPSRAIHPRFRNRLGPMRLASPQPQQRQPLMAASADAAASACPAYPYRASNILKAENEAYRRLLLPYVVREACAAGIPAGLLDALIIEESRYNALAISAKGAIGLTQLMPGTAMQLGANAWSVEDNIRGGATYLRATMDAFGGQAHLALAAYNAGPGAVTRYGGIPAFHETQSYVASILGLWRYLSQ